ncbi:MAG: hypothetical protein HY877_06685, partial [Deltaproteobacteria bacterium]|nr:hypothetical protein [Deltaproteobacteria bacterium]
LCLLFGIFSGYLTSLLEKVASDFGIFRNAPPFTSFSSGQGLMVGNGFASVSAPALFALLIGMIFIVVVVIQFAVNKNQKIKIGDTWNCGTGLTPRMEITATGFSRSIILIFRGVLKPSIQHEVEYHDSESRYLPKSRTVVLGVRDVYRSYFYQPLQSAVTVLSLYAKNIQSGNINTYISYIFIALVTALFFAL